ncbi:MAG: phospho-sugar mutase [Odoribacteraceae bacterium]|nr:phospho-sugar mutase [Odoribacteraceae bacterium]
MTDETEIIETARAKAEGWLDPAYDADTRAAVQQMLADADPAGLVDAFYNDLEFGTGGLRGIMGAGSNRMNIYTVGAATQGFANYINQQFASEGRSVCIGYDCRHNSRYFAETAADVFSANGIDVYLFEALRPTPEMSFAIRQLGCKGGVIITASHNPREYNGYKAYWDDGSQLVPPHDKKVIIEVKKTKVTDIRFERAPGRVHLLGADFDQVYLERVKQLSLSPDAIRAAGDLKIVFTPLHGTTFELVPESLRLWGFTGVHLVPEQSVPDGDFPTVASANPEEPAAFKMAIDLAREIDAELIMACDPDGDRIGISVKDDSGEWVLLNGNQANLLFIEYIITRRRELGLLAGGEYIVKTIVTTELLRDMAEKNGITCHDVYTGFKWIADMIRRRDPDKYIGGGEESFGFMPGAFTRDKDGVSSASLMAEIAAWCKTKGKSLYAFLKEIYFKYGFSRERMIYVVREGVTGAQEIRAMMEQLRNQTPRQINGSDVVLKKDYLTRTVVKPFKGTPSPLYFDTPSDVLQFFLADDSKISVRPSGTEPKIKFYFEARAPMKHLRDFEQAQQIADQRIDGMIKDIIKE